MHNEKSLSYDELKRRLEAAESALTAIREGRVDTISGERERLVEAEAREAHLKQVLLAIRNVNQLIVNEDDPRRLIERACVNLTETMGYHNVWIALMGGETARGLGLPTQGPVAATAAAGFDGGFEVLRECLERGHFPDCMNRALECDAVLVVGNPADDCPNCPLHGEYRGRAGLIRRLNAGGVTYAILTVSVPTAYAWDDEEQDLFNEVAGDLAFALSKIVTARKLEENRQHLHHVIEGSGVGTWEWNVQTNKILFNVQWAAMLGYTIEELQPYDYATWKRLVHSEDLEHARQALVDCVEGRTTAYNCEFRMRHKDGRWVWILDRGRILTCDDAGKALSMFGTHTDITDLKQTEEALRKAHELAERIIEDGPVGITTVNRDGEITFANKQAEQLFGLEKSEIQGRCYDAPDWKITDVDGSSFPDEELPFCRVMANDRAVCDVQHAIIRKNGDRRILSINGAPLHDAQGRIDEIVFAIQDVTERKRSEETLRESEQRFQKMLGVVPDMISIHSPEMDILYSNWQGFAAVPEEKRISNTKCYKTYRDFDNICPDCLARRVLETGKPCQEEARLPDGTWVDLRVIPLLDEDHNVEMFIEWVRDITGQKRVEEALQESESRVRTKLNALLDPEGDLETLNLADVVDCDEIQSLMDDFYALTDIGVGIIDLEGNVLVGTGWQDICTKFHRVHPETARNCIESDTLLASDVAPGTFKAYKCKNNLWDMVTPIRVGERHVGNLFLGQFFFEGETPNLDVFREQARRYGFDEEAYLEAYQSIPRWPRQMIDAVMTFYCNLIGVITRLSYAQIKLARMSDSLRQSEYRFRSFVENANDMVYALSPEGVFTYMSPNWLDFMGEPAEQVIGKSFEPYVHPEDVRLCRAFLEKTLTKGVKQSSVEYRIRHRDGSWRWHVSNGSPVQDESGTVTGIVGIARDMTKVKQAEEALVQSEKSYRDIFDNSSDCIFIHDAVTGAILDVNRTTCETFGYSVEEIKRLNVGDLSLNQPPYTSAEALVWVRKTCMEGPQRFEWLAKDRNGRLIWFENNLLHAKIAGKDSILVFGRNIDDRKHAETEHEKLQAQLRHAQKMEAVGRLAGGVAHDFNNMLGIIIGHADMILENTGPEEPLYSDLMEIRKAGVRSADLTRQLLTFARKQIVTPKVIDLNKTVEGMLKMLQRLIGEDIDMAWIPGKSVWPIIIDPSQIDQILANLCVNARDAIADVGKVTIETCNIVFDEDYCRNHAGFVAGEYAMLAVSDNGCGIDAETLTQVFEPFFTTKELGKGTGLGLATVYGAVKQNNGFINVYSEPGQGSTFKIYLPRHKAKVVPLSLKKSGMPHAFADETVLLVEDEPTILKMTAMMLERQGYTVLRAGTPGEAIRMAKQYAGNIHLLMTDVVMPEMNGRDLAGNILSLYPGIKCLFISGYTANVIAHHGVLDKGVNFIQKPFSKQDLAMKVREVLES